MLATVLDWTWLFTTDDEEKRGLATGGVTRLNWGYQHGLIYKMSEPNSAKQSESHAGVRGNLLPKKEDNGRETEPGDVVMECALMVAAS